MKYAITGHTSGIGKSLFEKLSPDVIGFSRSTGYDINSYSDRKKIIDESNKCDIFINNAPAGYGQVEMFIDLFREWKDKEKIIINVGSKITDIILSDDKLELLHYQSQKLILKQMSFRVKGICKVKYRTFGYVGTEAILKKYPNFTEANYISLAQTIDIILS